MIKKYLQPNTQSNVNNSTYVSLFVVIKNTFQHYEKIKKNATLTFQNDFGRVRVWKV